MVSPDDRTSGRERIAPEPTEPSRAAAFQYAFEQLSEARDYFGFYLRTRAELFKLAIRKFVFFGVLSVTAVLFGAALLVTAIVLLCRGVAEGLTILFGGHAWAGDLVTGALLLLVVGGTIFGTIVAISRSWKKRTFSAFAEERRRERRAAEENKSNEQNNG